jgi:transcriptional regulator GlxA family with amidase domain
MAGNFRRRYVRVAEIAAVIGVSQRRLRVLCMRDFGCSPMRLLADIRLYHVCQALASPDSAPRSMAEAARLAGFSSTGRFRSAYRDRYGTDPVIPAGTAPAPASSADSRPSLSAG